MEWLVYSKQINGMVSRLKISIWNSLKWLTDRKLINERLAE